MKKILIYISSISLLFSCQQEIVEQGHEAGLVSKTFDAMVENEPSTKLVMDGTFQSEYRSVLFEPDESVAVVEHVTKKVTEFRNSVEDENTDCAVFKGMAPEGDSYSALYPYTSSVYVSDGKFCFTMPETQYYVMDGMDDSAFPMVATLDDDMFIFKNLCGILVLKLQGVGAVERITFSASDEDGNPIIVSGSAKVKYVFDNLPEIEMTSTHGTKVKLYSEDGVALSETEPVPFHIVLPPGEYSSFEVFIERTDGRIMTKKSTKPLTITRSQRTTAATLVFVEDPVDITESVDLNADWVTANSYIVSEAGTYRFTPIKGNSVEPVEGISSVEVLWESFGTDEETAVGDLISRLSYVEGQIAFTTPSVFKKGNAVIAAKDDAGNILWSWHIWFTDKPGEQTVSGSIVLMDRNLGVSDLTNYTHGVYYQWGRKDPFVGNAMSTHEWPDAVVSDANTGTVDYSVQNPMTFITANEMNFDWYYPDSTTEDEHGDYRWQPVKTMYDPCPPGWKVSSEAVWNKYNFDTWRYDEGGFVKLYYAGSNGSAAYPLSGMISQTGTLESVGSSGYYWTSGTATADTGYPYRYQMVVNNSDQQNELFTPQTTATGAIGCSVRCERYDEISNMGQLATDLNESGKMANSYIIPQPGIYKFKTVKGNSEESVGDIASVSVIWESFGTDMAPKVGDLIESVKYEGGIVYFCVDNPYHEGNALIAVKNASNEILWSWHIWLTDKPEEQVYYNNAGTMMDRNLGATSATPGDVGAIGLLYQWGRKDPFLGSYDIGGENRAVSTISWPSAVDSKTCGTIEYSIKNPTTFIVYSLYDGQYSNCDWYYTGSNSVDNTRWQSDKTIYDPCPIGWRVPNGGQSGVWAQAMASSSYLNIDTTNGGANLSLILGNSSVIWYPAVPTINASTGGLSDFSSCIWSVTPVPNDIRAYCLYINNGMSNAIFDPSYDLRYRAGGQSVRCVKD